MCDPVSIAAATFAIGAATSVSSYIGGKQAYAANKDAANLNYAREREVVGQQASQMDQENSERALDTAIATVRSEGDIAASASDQGLAPTSIVQKLNADMFGIGRQDTAAALNDRNRRQQLGSELTGADITRQTQINSKSKPTLVGLGLSLGTNALQAASAYSGAKGK